MNTIEKRRSTIVHVIFSFLYSIQQIKITKLIKRTMPIDLLIESIDDSNSCWKYSYIFSTLSKEYLMNLNEIAEFNELISFYSSFLPLNISQILKVGKILFIRLIWFLTLISTLSNTKWISARLVLSRYLIFLKYIKPLISHIIDWFLDLL